MLARLRPYVQYVYYLRFSLALLLALPVIAWTDHETRPSQFLHAIFTPEKFGQFVGCAFFAICNGWVALLIARVICLNGGQRFRTPERGVPSVLAWWLGERSNDKALWVLLGAQAPNIYLFWRLHRNSFSECVPLAHNGMDLLGFFVGIWAALAFWYLINSLYYWTFPFSTFQRSAHTLLFPRAWFWLGPAIPPMPTFLDSIEGLGTVHSPHLSAPTEWVFKCMASLGGVGYRDRVGAPLWEGHRLLSIGFAGYLGVYLALWPITAPLPEVLGTRLALGATALLLMLLAGALNHASPIPRAIRTRRFQRVMVFALILLACIICILFLRTFSSIGPHIPNWLAFYFLPPLQFFPVLGSVAVLLTLITFVLSGVAFYLDRFALPVITPIVLLIAFTHGTSKKSGESYFNAVRVKKSALLTPADIISKRCTSKLPCNLIVVTATGGGIHASVWTATVLSKIEEAIAAETIHPSAKSLHEQLVFASTVSGGSLGFASFLHEYLGPAPFTFEPLATDRSASFEVRMRRAAGCSTLEAIAWGLEYSDFLHLTLPLPPSHKYDRGNALEVASARNYTEKKCGEHPLPQGSEQLPSVEDINHFSLASLPPSATFPAFTLNTTEVETGERFLLANYYNGEASKDWPPLAESFLHAFPGTDIGVLTAARLSATYPYVSPAARVDDRIISSPITPHFADGGYFDNDGIASMVEFLSSAFPGSGKPRDGGKVRILLIEIRDGNIVEPKSLDSESRPWGILQQNAAPIETFWRTGHGSISLRNRRELQLLNGALRDQVELKDVTFPFTPQEVDKETGKKTREEAPPLSWQLTPRQRKVIDDYLKEADFKNPLEKVLAWTRFSPTPPPPPTPRVIHRRSAHHCRCCCSRKTGT